MAEGGRSGPVNKWLKTAAWRSERALWHRGCRSDGQV